MTGKQQLKLTRVMIAEKERLASTKCTTSARLKAYYQAAEKNTISS